MDKSCKDDDCSEYEDWIDLGEVKRFRLLIIGRSGCGKTSILSKVCGEEVADKPSTTRGVHDIEREMEFKDNKLFVVHDSEGFEAGQEDEFQVVVNFIQSRSRMQDIDDRLHAIWYCLTTNSRPFQQSEEMFFSVKHEVPVVAIFTKFDLFVEDQLQVLMENVECQEDLNEEELEQQAAKVTMEKFDKHYKSALLQKPYPPQGVVTVSNVHISTTMDSRLAELVNATSETLNIKTDESDNQRKLDSARLASLFASAQMADLQHKYKASIFAGMPPFRVRYKRAREGFEFCQASETHSNLEYSLDRKLQASMIIGILSAFECFVENHPQTLCNESSLKLPQMITLTSLEQEACRCVQLVAGLTVIMTEIFLLKVQDASVIKDIVGGYPNTPAFAFIQKTILELDWWSSFDKARWRFFLYQHREEVLDMVDVAVRLNIGTKSSYSQSHHR